MTTGLIVAVTIDPTPQGIVTVTVDTTPVLITPFDPFCVLVTVTAGPVDVTVVNTTGAVLVTVTVVGIGST